MTVTSGHNRDTSQPLRRYLQASDLAAPSAQGCWSDCQTEGHLRDWDPSCVLCGPSTLGTSNAQCLVGWPREEVSFMGGWWGEIGGYVSALLCASTRGSSLCTLYIRKPSWNNHRNHPLQG